MLQIKHISKQYRTGDLVQQALDDVSLTLRDNEFVSILGPSGSGKTTLLNVIGGLDRYDSGDLVINGISTKKYKDRDWDSYRNHTIGFVFQSYNLIPHQTVLSNVELALTISGISKAERRKRAEEALKKVGLGEQLHKKPNQMSGGQMQRVAIARALVNDPDILLADEPTGALDTDTSIQVMELLKEVAKDRLVVMVTHNPELAEQYATRIVRLRDGRITDDSNPYEIDESKLKPAKHKNMGKSSMSFLTSLSLSFNNLRTKKARTLLTSFAGSIGIIGIAMILALSNGVNNYIINIQKNTMASYPISIEAETMDLSSIFGTAAKSNSDELEHKLDAVYPNGSDIELASTMTSSITTNNLTDFKKYLDNKNSDIHKYIGENGIVYGYNTKFNVYTYDSEDTLVNTNGSTLLESSYSGTQGQMMSDMITMQSMMESSDTKNTNFSQLLPDKAGTGISSSLKDSYDIVYGEWPDKYNELVLVLDKNNEIASTTLYELGLLPSSEYKDMMKKMSDGEEVEVKSTAISYKDICNKEFNLIPACDLYEKNSSGNFSSVENDSDKIKELMKNSITLKISGIIRENDDTNSSSQIKVGYTKALTNYLIEYTENSEIVKAQKANKDINVLNGLSFKPVDDNTKIADTKKYLKNLGISEKAAVCKSVAQSAYANNQKMLSQITSKSEAELASMLDEYLKNPNNSVLLSIYEASIKAGSYDDNMTSFGVVSVDAPSSINIYVDSFEDKNAISECIENYNNSVDEKDKITYTDYVGLLMSSITTIINVISYVLIAFVSVSLIVSSIMIGIITYISVLERTKEIGILRAIGASKRNISQVFNAETFIIGLGSGIIGIGVSLILTIPCNAIIHAVTGNSDVNAALPVVGAVILIILSVILTLIGGIIPSRKAAKRDPVRALRTE